MTQKAILPAEARGGNDRNGKSRCSQAGRPSVGLEVEDATRRDELLVGPVNAAAELQHARIKAGQQ